MDNFDAKEIIKNCEEKENEQFDNLVLDVLRRTYDGFNYASYSDIKNLFNNKIEESLTRLASRNEITIGFKM